MNPPYRQEIAGSSMKRFLTALVACFFTIQMAFVPAEAGALRKLEAIYTATKIVKTANAARKRATLVRKYIKEMESVSGHKISVKQFAEVRKCMQNAATCLNKNASKNWDKDRPGAIKQWVKSQREKWPVYKENIISAKGSILGGKGKKFDAHHIIPKKYGGPNTGWNITPMPKPGHNSIVHAR